MSAVHTKSGCRWLTAIMRVAAVAGFMLANVVEAQAKDQCKDGAILLKFSADAQCRIDADARSHISQFVANIRASGRHCPDKQRFVVRAIKGDRFEGACDLDQSTVEFETRQLQPRWVSCGQFSATIHAFGFVDDFNRKQGLWHTYACGTQTEGYEMYRDGALLRRLSADNQRVRAFVREGQEIATPSATGFDGYESADRK